MDDKQRRSYEEQKILLEQFNDAPKRRTPDPSRTAKMRKRRRKKRIRQTVAFSAVVAVIIAAIILIVRGCSAAQKDALYGKWNLDGTTVYVFDGKGNGKMELPEKSYDFQYTIQDSTVIIDFTDENAKDFTYDFTVENDTLTLVGKEKKETFTYSFKKQNE